MRSLRLWLSRVRLAVNGWREVSREDWWNACCDDEYEIDGTAEVKFYIRRRRWWHRTLF